MEKKWRVAGTAVCITLLCCATLNSVQWSQEVRTVFH